jgi:hypothetical protein
LRKLTCTILLITILISGIAFVSNAPFGKAQTSTPVNGIITKDTTWTQANSPYNLTGNVLINSGTTVTVEAGATLNLNGYYIRVNGSLIVQQGVSINMQNAATIQVNGVLSAKGTSVNPILVNGSPEIFHIQPVYSSIIFSVNSAGWDSQAVSGSIIEYTVLKTTTVTVSSSIKVDKCTFTNSGLNIMGGSPSITNTVLGEGITFTGGTPLISNNTINSSVTCNGVEPKIGNGNSAIIQNNVISGIPPGYSAIVITGHSLGCNIIIEGNLIMTSLYPQSYGIDIDFGDNVNASLNIVDNTIINNAVGIYIRSNVTQLSGNNIYNNTLNVKLGQSNSVDCTNNWWGTTNQQTINQTIYDFKDDFNLGIVNFIPFLTAPNTQAIPVGQAQMLSSNMSTLPTVTPEYPLTTIIIITIIAVSLMVLASNKTKKK